MNPRFLFDPGFRFSERTERLLQCFHQEREDRIGRRLFWVLAAALLGSIAYFIATQG